MKSGKTKCIENIVEIMFACKFLQIFTKKPFTCGIEVGGRIEKDEKWYTVLYSVQCTEEKVSEIVHMQNAEFCKRNQAENIYIFERKQAWHKH